MWSFGELAKPRINKENLVGFFFRLSQIDDFLKPTTLDLLEETQSNSINVKGFLFFGILHYSDIKF